MRLTLAAVTFVLAVQPGWATEAGLRKMSDEDFFLDRKSLLGKPVEVTSRFEVKGDLMFMSLKNDTNVTFVSFDKLPRDDRKSIYARCQSECKGTVQGIVSIIGSLFGNDIGIKASKITLDP